MIGQRDRSIIELQQKEQQQAEELLAAQAAEEAAARELAVQQQQLAAASGTPTRTAATGAPVVVADGLHAAPSAQRAPAFSISNESGGGARAAPRASGLTHLTTESLGSLGSEAAREVQEVVARLGASEHRLGLTDAALRVRDAQL